MAVLATVAILVNVLFMQKGSHPAPMFKGAVAPVKTTVVTETIPAAAPRARPAEATPVAPAATAAPGLAAQGLATARSAPAQAPRTPGEIITDIQRELGRRGYYDGIVDGLYGPKTDSAIRDFEQAAGLKPSNEPNETLLQAIQRAPAKPVKVTTAAPPPAVRPPMPVRNDAAPRADAARTDARNDAAAPSKRVIALQRALADFGYGQIKASGIIDGETQAAIEKFERERKLPVTGQASDRVLREMTAMTGRPLE
jgi:peptidoglycan hydrolase-like protein with peptidoglycan-binding domain